MTRQHFKLIAETINDYIKTSNDNGQRLTQDHADNLIDMFSNALAKTNGMFDRQRFETACKK